MTSTLQPGWVINALSKDAGATSTVANWNAMVTAGLKFVLAKAYEHGSGTAPSGFPEGTDPAWRFHKTQMERVAGSIVKGAWCFLHNGGEADQADTFLDLIDETDHDPTGWLCVVRVDGVHGQDEPPPGYPSLQRFAKEFWEQAPGHPLILWTRKTYWNSRWGDKSAKALGLNLMTTATALTQPNLGNCVDGTDLGSINITAFDTSATKLSFGGNPKAPFSGNYAGFSGHRSSSFILWGTLKLTGSGTEDGVAFDGTVAQLLDLTTVAEPVQNKNHRPSPVFAQGFVTLPTAVASVSNASHTPDPVFARAFIAQARGGQAVSPGTAVVSSDAPSATITGGA